MGVRAQSLGASCQRLPQAASSRSRKRHSVNRGMEAGEHEKETPKPLKVYALLSALSGTERTKISQANKELSLSQPWSPSATLN